MKFPFLILTIILSSTVFSQAIEDGYIQTFKGENYYLKYTDDKYYAFDNDSNRIFDQGFDYCQKLEYGDYFKAYLGENKLFIINPSTKYLFEYPEKLKLYFPFNNVGVTQSVFSKTDLIVLGDWTYMKMDGSSIIFDGNSYSESETDLSPKLALRTELDYLLEDSAFWAIPDSELDEFALKHKFLLSLSDKWLVEHHFDELYMVYEPIDQPSSETLYSERYFSVKQNKKFGVISTVGKYILEPIYDKIQFIEFEFDYESKNYMFITAELKNKSYLFNSKGEQLAELDGIKIKEYTEPYGIGSDFYFRGFEIDKKKKSGLINEFGQIIVPPTYDAIDFVGGTNSQVLRSNPAGCNSCPFDYYAMGLNRRKGLWTFYNSEGTALNSFSSGWITDYQKNGFFAFDFDGLYALIGPGASIIKRPEFENIELFHGNKDIFIATSADESWFMDVEGAPLFGMRFSEAFFIDTNYAWVNFQNKVGLADVKASGQTIKWLFEPEYEKIDETSANYMEIRTDFILCKNGKCGIMNDKKETVVPFEYDHLVQENGNFIGIQHGKYSLLNSNYRTYFSNKYDSLLKINYDLWFVKENGKWGIWSVSEEKIKTGIEYEKIILNNTKSNHYIVRKNGKWGVLNKNFEWFIKPEYLSIEYLYGSDEFQCLNLKMQNDCFKAQN